MATFMQAWPHVGAQDPDQKASGNSSPRIASARTWARKLNADGKTSEVNLDKLHAGDIIVVNDGEIIPGRRYGLGRIGRGG